MARLYVVEENNNWSASKKEEVTKIAVPILDKLEHNPFVRLDHMNLSSSSVTSTSVAVARRNQIPQLYDQAKALVALKKNEQGWAELMGEQPFPLKATLSRGDWRNTVMLMVANKRLTEIDQPVLFTYLAEVAALFPKFKLVDVQVDGKIAEFYEERDLSFLPDCFSMFLSWYYLISPLAYEPYLTREEMLLIPAHRVQEVGDAGWIELVMYEDPLSYGSPQTRECIVELTNYINERRHDWTANAARPQKAGVR